MKLKFLHEYIDQAKNPSWEKFDAQYKHVHDWRTYISDEVREKWDLFTMESKCLAIHISQEVADREYWD